MASKKIEEITTRYSMLQSLSVSDLEDSLQQHICYIHAMQALQTEQNQQAGGTN